MCGEKTIGILPNNDNCFEFSVMDFTPELSAFQGVLISADNVHAFSRLTAKGGNEEEIKYVLNNLSRFLEQQNYITPNGLVCEKMEKIRKFAYYIILNADLPSLDSMVENDGIDSVIWTVPTIPQCLMSEILWHLRMDRFVYEAIAFSYADLSLEIAEAMIEYLKYSSPSESLPKLRTVLSALYLQICRFHFFSFESDVLSELLKTAFNHFQKCVKYFYEPINAYKLASLNKDELYKYKGNCLRTMINLIQDCMFQFTNVLIFAPDCFIDVYQPTYKVGTYNEDALAFAICNSPIKPIAECLDKCNEVLLDSFKHLVMDVSVDIFCAWSEFEENGKSMQQNIGELCYKLRLKLLNINVISEHPVVSMIQQISRKPIEIHEIVNASDSNTIIENIKKSNANQAEWIRALIHKNGVCQDVVLLELLSSHINMLNEDDSHLLYKLCITHLTDHIENADIVKLLAMKAFTNCSFNVKNKILEEHFYDNCFTDALESVQFNEMLTEIFNKVISGNVDLTDILTVFLQNPQKVFTKIFSLSSESSQQADIMLRAVILLKKFSNHYYNQDTEPCIIRVAENVLDSLTDIEATQKNLIKFICGLKTADVVPGTKLLLLIIMPKLHKGLLERNVSQIYFQCKLLSEAFSLEELLPYRAPMLAMIAQILEVVRWKITRFQPGAPSALELALSMQVKLFDTFQDGIPEKEETWLKSKLRKLHPLNCYYYRKLWNPPGGNFVEIVSGSPVKVDDSEQLVGWLSQVLSSTTQTEWCTIWDSLSMFTNTQKLNMFHDALTLIPVAGNGNREDRNPNTWQCVMYCCKNYVFVVRYKYFKEPLTNEQVSTFVSKISLTANLIEAEDLEQFTSIVMPLFAYLVTRKDDYNVNVAEAFAASLRNDAFLTIVNKVFTNGAV